LLWAGTCGPGALLQSAGSSKRAELPASGSAVNRAGQCILYLAGDVTAAGDVRIHMHGQRSDGSRLAVMDLAGTLQDGRIDAKGSFLNGRSVTLNWRRN
jgi:hypothetical protein